MSRTFICSTGTSAAKLLVDDSGRRLPPGMLREWVTQQGGSENAARRMLATFQDFRPVGDALTEKLSAEIHSLARMGLEAKDRVLLLSSDTPEGLACAKAVEGYLVRYQEGLQVITETVAGLQVDDAEKFRRVGVVEFTKRCLREIGDYQSSFSGKDSNVVLNPTGGFKALVPYTVLIGMLKNVPCRYIFEHIRQEVTLSAIGLLFLDEVRTTTKLVPFLSRQAWVDCWDNLQHLNDCEPFRFLARMSSPQTLADKTHINVGNGLRWLKPGRTTDRYLVSVEGWRLLVWRAIREDQIGGDYPQQVVVDSQRDRAKYAPFTRLEFSR